MSEKDVNNAINDLGKSWDIRFSKVEERVEDHDVDLRGNDKPGMKARLKTMEDKFKNIDWGTKILVAFLIVDILGRVFT